MKSNAIHYSPRTPVVRPTPSSGLVDSSDLHIIYTSSTQEMEGQLQLKLCSEHTERGNKTNKLVSHAPVRIPTQNSLYDRQKRLKKILTATNQMEEHLHVYYASHISTSQIDGQMAHARPMALVTWSWMPCRRASRCPGSGGCQLG